MTGFVGKEFSLRLALPERVFLSLGRHVFEPYLEAGGNSSKPSRS
jgi:hypothetical protein